MVFGLRLIIIILLGEVYTRRRTILYPIQLATALDLRRKTTYSGFQAICLGRKPKNSPSGLILISILQGEVVMVMNGDRPCDSNALGRGIDLFHQIIYH